MDIEIDQTVEIIQKKREAADRQECVENDLKRITQEFYCESCDKRYKNVSEMSNHLSSYDHHHKKVLHCTAL
jgi:Zinc-finger double-stranded RNA-binding